MRIGLNITIICLVALICITAVAIAALASGIDGTLTLTAFTLLGAIPAGIGMKLKKDSEIKKIKNNQ